MLTEDFGIRAISYIPAKRYSLEEVKEIMMKSVAKKGSVELFFNDDFRGEGKSKFIKGLWDTGELYKLLGYKHKIMLKGTLSEHRLQELRGKADTLVLLDGSLGNVSPEDFKKYIVHLMYRGCTFIGFI